MMKGINLKALRQQGRESLSEAETKELLRRYGIPTTDFQIPRIREELETMEIRFPVAVKISSSKILHKTEVSGIHLNVPDRQEMIRKYDMIKKNFPDSDVLIEPMEEGGVEVIVGLLHDGTFDLSIMFGMGGILTELYRDVTFRAVPIDRYDAKEMLDEIKGAKLLQGFRGIKTDREALISLLIRVCRMGDELRNDVNQLDLNPVLVREKGCVVVDAKLIFEPP